MPLLRPPVPYEKQPTDHQIFLEKVRAEYKPLLKLLHDNPEQEFLFAKFPDVRRSEQYILDDFTMADQIRSWLMFGELGTWCNSRVVNEEELWTAFYREPWYKRLVKKWRS